MEYYNTHVNAKWMVFVDEPYDNYALFYDNWIEAFTEYMTHIDGGIGATLSNITHQIIITTDPNMVTKR